MAIFGLGNAGCRVHEPQRCCVPNAMMGRVSMFFNAADRLLRTILISLSTTIVVHHSPPLLSWPLAGDAFCNPGAFATRSLVAPLGDSIIVLSVPFDPGAAASVNQCAFTISSTDFAILSA